MLSMKSYDDCIKFLKNHSWAEGLNTGNIDEIVSFETCKALKVIKKLSLFNGALPDELNLILYRFDFNNLKLAIKSFITGKSVEGEFLPYGNIKIEAIVDALKERNFEALPIYIKNCAKDAFDVLLKTNDGQMCDTIIDAGMLKAINEIKKCTKLDFVRKYAELFVVSCNVKTAIRSCKYEKSKEFSQRAIVECDTLDKEKLVEAASESLDLLYEYLLTTDYGIFVAVLKDSLVLFDKCIEDELIKLAKGQKSNSFTVAPVIAYFLAKENEMKTVRMVCISKKIGLKTETIKERLRQTYA